MDLEQFKNLQEIIEKQLEWDEENILEMEKKLGKIFQRLTDIFFKVKVTVDNLDLDIKKMYSDLYVSLKQTSKISFDNNNKIDNYINSDQAYYNLNVEFNTKKAMLDWIEKTLSNINNVKFEIKDFMNWKMFKSGASF